MTAMKPSTAQGTRIPGELLQSVLDSATNAAEKGLSAFYTPPEFAMQLAVSLPSFRPVLCDLNCGDSHLLEAAVNERTEHLLGADIGPGRKSFRYKLTSHHVDRIQLDLTLLYPMLVEVDWHADLILLNPPWGLRWHRERLELLAESGLPGVADAFKAHDQQGRATIDSTIATLLIALDRLGPAGEGYLIGNHATLDRLLFAKDAPHAAAAVHVWHRQVFDGNPMTGDDRHRFSGSSSSSSSSSSFSKDEVEKENGGGSPFKTEVIWFARDHRHGPVNRDLAAAPLRRNKAGAHLTDYTHTRDTAGLWDTVKTEVEQRASPTPQYNLWLHSNGTIGVHLSHFAERSKRTDKVQAKGLLELKGRRPMQAIISREQRTLLLNQTGLDGDPTPWTVHPDLIDTVKKALADYELSRAPVYPLNPIQRLGYLDEADTIKCLKDFADGLFLAGRTYAIRSKTVETKRFTTKPNLMGDPEECELTGQELAFFIKAENGKERLFMDALLKQSESELPSLGREKDEGQSPKAKPRHRGSAIRDLASGNRDQPASGPTLARNVIDHTHQELVDHFEIPDVPDVARVFPARYEANLRCLAKIEDFLNAQP